MRTQRFAAVNASNNTPFLTVNYHSNQSSHSNKNTENESGKYEADASCKDDPPEELNLFTPFSSSHSNTITTNTSFIFDSEEELLDLHNQYSDDTDCEDYEECDTDCIPLIERITPPPPLCFADYHYYAQSDEEEHEHEQEQAAAAGAYRIEYQYHDDDHVYADEDEDESHEQHHKLLSNLSILIPSHSSNQLHSTSKASPAKSSKSKRFLFDAYTASSIVASTPLTPSSSDHEPMEHEHDDNMANMYKSCANLAIAPSPAFPNVGTGSDDDDEQQEQSELGGRQRVEKRFRFDSPSADNNGYHLSHYLNAHIQSLLDETFSD